MSSNLPELLKGMTTEQVDAFFSRLPALAASVRSGGNSLEQENNMDIDYSSLSEAERQQVLEIIRRSIEQKRAAGVICPV